MYYTKFLGLVVSALLSITPVYTPTDIEFPFDRVDKVFIRIAYRVDDLGQVSIGGLYHDYNIDYNIQISCSSACTLTNPTGGTVLKSNDNYFEYHVFSRVSNKSPDQMIALLRNADDIVQKAQVNTYNAPNSIGTIQIPLNLDYGSLTINVYFPAMTDQMVLLDIDARLDELSDWYFLKNFLMDKDIPSSAIQDVQTYINNGDYSSAVQYVENYYINNSVTTNENNEQVVNNYSSKETNLNTYFNTENNFTTGIENNFQQQQQLLPDTNQSIQDLQSSSFLQSANWVTQQFNRMTVNNPLGKLLIFSLFTGFILALIGRFKR